MKSTTISRSNLSKEKMAVLEALKQYKSDNADFAPGVYIRPDDIRNEKRQELDLLWRNFKIQDISAVEKTPKIYATVGIVALAVLIAGFSMTAFFAGHSVNVADGAKAGFSFVPSSSDSAEEVAGQNETYVVQSGDTIEKILIRFHGQYSKSAEQTLLQANNMKNPNRLSIGQELIIPMN